MNVKKAIILIASLLLIGLTAKPLLAEEINRKQTRREEFKVRVAKIKDENKQRVAVRIDEELNKLNARAIARFNNILTRLTTLLDKLEKKATDQESVVKARSAIEAAKIAVAEQAKKIYVIEFTHENGLKVGASAAKNSLKVDLQLVRDKVKIAREAVVSIFQTVKEAK